LESKPSANEIRSDKFQSIASPEGTPPAWVRLLIPSAADLIFIILLAAMTVGLLAQRLLGDASIGWHIRNGEQMLRTHSITRSDPFSVTMGGKPWYAWEWLYDCGIAAIHHWLGLNGVLLLTALIIAVTFALAFRLSLRRGADLPSTTVLLAFALGASTIHMLTRPHVLSWLFAVVWFQILYGSETGDPEKSRRLWWLPVLMMLWVNLHGGFILGFVVLGLYLLSHAIRHFRCRDEEMCQQIARRLQHLGVISGAVTLASLLNPYGYKLHLHVYQYLSSRWLMNHIDEFLSPNFHGIAQQCFVALLLITIVALAWGQKKPPLSRLLVLLFAAFSGLYASRSLPVSSLLLTLIAAPLLTQAQAESGENDRLSPWLRRWLSRWRSFAARLRRTELSLRGHLWPLAAVALGLVVCTHQGRLESQQWIRAHFDGKKFPDEAASVIAERGLQEPIFSLDSWGGYLIYRLYPQIKVFVDDRHDLYGEEFLKDYLKAVRLTPDWDTFLSEKRVNWVLAPKESALANMLVQTSQWEVVHRDGTAILFERKAKL
jgi:hypothetical protein